MRKQKGGVFRGRKRQRGKKQKGGMPKAAKKLVQATRKFSAKGLTQLAKIIKPKNQKGGVSYHRGRIGEVISPGQIFKQRGGLYRPYNHRREYMYYK